MTTDVDLTGVPREGLEAELRRRDETEPTGDRFADLLIGHLERRLEREREEIEAAERKARQQAQRTSDLIGWLRHEGALGVTVTVSISDPYDLSYRGESVGSVAVTGVGLEEAVRNAEREHEHAAGKIRIDGELSYQVTARLADGSTVEVPDEVWLRYSAQTEESIRRRREVDERQRTVGR